MIQRIDYVVYPARLVPDAPGVSLWASADTLADLIRQELCAAYPGAEVAVRVSRPMEILAPDACLRVTTDDGDDQGARQAVEQIIRRICTDRLAEWVVTDRTAPMTQTDVAAIAVTILCHLLKIHPPGTIHPAVRAWASRIISDPAYAEPLAEQMQYDQLSTYQAGVTSLVADLCHDLVRCRQGATQDLAPAIIWAYLHHLRILARIQ
mgnify:FL=1